jgi:hypothetical protein
LKRPWGTLVADKVLARVIEIVGPTGLIERRNSLEENLRLDIPDLDIKRGIKKSLSKDVYKDKSAVGLMVYEPRISDKGATIFITGASYTIVLKQFEYWILAGIDPQLMRSHLYERIQERFGDFVSVAELQDKLSEIWTPLVWMKIQKGGISTPLQYFTPWNGGLFYGKVRSADVEANSNVIARAANAMHGSKDFEFTDEYSTKDGKKRLWATTPTFVSVDKLKHHQIILRDKLNKFVDAHRQVIDYLKLSWRIAPRSSQFTPEILDIFKVRKPEQKQIDRALSAIEKIVECKEWQIEAEFSRQSQRRHQADAIAKKGTPRPDLAE